MDIDKLQEAVNYFKIEGIMKYGNGDIKEALNTLISLATQVVEVSGNLEVIIAEVYCEQKHSKKTVDTTLIQSIATKLRNHILGRENGNPI